MAIQFECETCKRPINVKIDLAGRDGVCPHCSEHLLIPETTLMSDGEFREAKIKWFAANPGASASGTRLPEIPADVSVSAAPPPMPVVAKGPAPVVGQPFELDDKGVGVMTNLAIGPKVESVDPLAETPDALWYVRPPSGGQFGPASAQLFRQWIQEGRVSGDSWIWRQGWDDWQQATGCFPDLKVSAVDPELNLSQGVSSPSARTRAAYFRARRRRTIWTAVGLVGGVIVVGALIFLLAWIVGQQGGA